MPTPSPIAKVSIGKSGYGSAHAAYITRLSALDPEGRESGRGGDQRGEQLSLFALDDTGMRQPTVLETLEDNLSERGLAGGKEHGAPAEQNRVDPIWTWNAPEFLTRDGGRAGPDAERREGPETTRVEGERRDKLTLKEKVQNAKDYFGSLEDYERRKGGRTHYRIILSFDVPASNEQIRDLTNRFLEQAFPKSIAFGAIHRDTEHPHVHLYLNSRQIDGKRIQLKNNEFKTIDEKWAAIYAEFAGDKSVYVEYIKKKEETKLWKIAAAEAFRKGEPIPPKPERDSDRREKLAERRLSAQRSKARDSGKQPGPRPQAEPVSRPASEKETSRLIARHEVAGERLAHLIRNDAPDREVKTAARTFSEFAAALEKTRTARKEMGRERMPQVVYTTEEWKQLKEYRTSRDAPAKDDHAAARVQSGRIIAGAELKDAQGKAEAFQHTRHFWKFDVEGWDKQLSLREVESAIQSKSAERLKLHNFLRPSTRETIQGQIDYLHEVKADIQKQLVAREHLVNKDLGAAQVRYDTAAKQAENVARTRTAHGRALPLPTFNRDELGRMTVIATRNKDGPLLQYVYDQVRNRLLQNPTEEALSRVKGNAVLARMEMMKEANRVTAAWRFGEFRQVPMKDSQGVDYTKSIRQVSPRGALETIIRHFTDTAEQKREQKELRDTAAAQLRRAEEQSIRARDFSVTMDRILDDHCRAAGVSPRGIAPMLNSQQIAELREFAETLSPFSGIRKEFSEAARLAEQELRQRETPEAFIHAQEARTHDPSVRPREQSPSQVTTSNERSDRDSSSRGR